MFFDKKSGRYVLNDSISVGKGCALGVITFNSGKTDMLGGNGVYNKVDVEKIQKTIPNIKVLSQRTVYCGSRSVQDGRSTQSILVLALDDFDIAGHQVFKSKTNKNDETTGKSGSLATDAFKLAPLGKDGKEYIGDDRSNVEATKEDGAMLFIGTKPMNPSVDKSYLNLSKSNRICVGNLEFYLEKKISDKGGFN